MQSLECLAAFTYVTDYVNQNHASGFERINKVTAQLKDLISYVSEIENHLINLKREIAEEEFHLEQELVLFASILDRIRKNQELSNRVRLLAQKKLLVEKKEVERKGAEAIRKLAEAKLNLLLKHTGGMEGV